jgi:signal transduction histidine kinase
MRGEGEDGGGQEEPTLSLPRAVLEALWSGIARVAGVLGIVAPAGGDDASAVLREQRRLTALVADVSVALTRADDLPRMLQRCAEAMVDHLDAAFARIWTLDPASEVLVLRASAGMYTHLDGPHGRVPVGTLEIGLIAQERRPYLTNAVIGDPRVGDQAWARWEGMVAFAGYPLVVADRVVGVMAMFVRHPLTDFSLRALAAVADGIAVGIERKRSEEELRNSEARVRAILESARLKAEFLANMSHEIRTPMNGVIGMTGLLLETTLDDAQREAVDTIRRCGESLVAIINDILDFSKIEAGKLRIECVDFGLRSVVDGVMDLLAENARVKSLEFAALVREEVPYRLRGDPGRLRQILTNLVGNAIKFTEKGEVLVHVTRESDTATHVVIRTAVRDTGIGVSKADRRGLFQAFSQGDGSTTCHHGGTGLGLAISKSLVEMMGGEIGVDSTPGGGSTFWFTARLEKQPHKEPGCDLLARGAMRGARALVVDDSATQQGVLRHYLGAWGMRSDAASSAPQALEMLRRAAIERDPYAVALLDLQLPTTDGLALATAAKADAATASTRLVLVIPGGPRQDGDAMRAAGVEAWVTKPIRQSQLFDCLATVLA